MSRFAERVRRVLREESGFTLPEMLVTIMLMLIVMFALYSIFDMSIRVFSFGNDKVEAVENARLGLEKMEREIRAAYPVDKASGKEHLFFSATDSTSAGTAALPSTVAGLNANQRTSITFGNDLNGNRKIECPPPTTPPSPPAPKCEFITYKLSQSGSPRTMLRNASSTGSVSGSGGEPVVEYVKPPTATPSYPGGLMFTFLKSDGTDATAADGTDIEIVRLQLDIEIDKESLGTRTQTLTTDVALRNRG